MYFENITIDKIEEYTHLLSSCFPESVMMRSIQYIKWLYFDNPDGEVIGFDAIIEGRLVAHYVCLPTLLHLNNKIVKAMLSLNTATHKDFRGRGLFPILASKTYEYAQQIGIEAVYGVANKLSTPGFTQKLGFQLVCPLDAWIGLGKWNLTKSWDDVIKDAAFRRFWRNESIIWRISNPFNKLRLQLSDQTLSFYGRSSVFGVDSYAVSNINYHLPESFFNQDKISFKPKVYLGKFPSKMTKPINFFSIPERFKPSPLNLIYLNLKTMNDKINEDSVLLNFLDFDAF